MPSLWTPRETPALEEEGRTFLLAGSSRCGKSTLTWALAHHGFRFLSDELVPVDLDLLELHPFPRALCLEARPSASHLPPGAGVVRFGRRFPVPTAALPCPVADAPIPLIVFLLRGDPQAAEPLLCKLGLAAARVQTHALNPLADPAQDLEGVLRIAASTSCFELVSADAAPSAGLVVRTVRELAAL